MLDWYPCTLSIFVLNIMNCFDVKSFDRIIKLKDILKTKLIFVSVYNIMDRRLLLLNKILVKCLNFVTNPMIDS